MPPRARQSRTTYGPRCAPLLRGMAGDAPDYGQADADCARAEHGRCAPGKRSDWVSATMSTGPPLRSDRDQWSPVWIGNSNRLPEPSRCAESTLCEWAKVARSRTKGSEGLVRDLHGGRIWLGERGSLCLPRRCFCNRGMSERDDRIGELYEAALKKPIGDRLAFVASRAGSDLDL